MFSVMKKQLQSYFSKAQFFLCLLLLMHHGRARKPRKKNMLVAHSLIFDWVFLKTPPGIFTPPMTLQASHWELWFAERFGIVGRGCLPHTEFLCWVVPSGSMPLVKEGTAGITHQQQWALEIMGGHNALTLNALLLCCLLQSFNRKLQRDCCCNIWMLWKGKFTIKLSIMFDTCELAQCAKVTTEHIKNTIYLAMKNF